MTVTAETFEQAFVEGFAQLLAGAGIGLTWDPAAKYATGQTGIYIAPQPTDPDRAVTLASYDLSDDPVRAQSEVGIQIRARTAPYDKRGLWALGGLITDALLGRSWFTLPTGITVSTLIRSSSTEPDQDDSKRWQWASSYTANLHRPSRYRH